MLFVLKVLKWLLLLIVGLVVLAVVLAHFSARSVLDDERHYTQGVAALPEFYSHSPDGLVRISAGGMEFRVRVAGFDRPQPGPLVVLLHGFPVTSAMYKDLIPALADRGYRVLAPDQRGYSPGARPQGSASYNVTHLSEDVFALVDAVGDNRFHLVGHDWGAIVGWSTLLRAPERVISWSGLSIPHPAAFADALENDPVQKERSAYFYVFATPWLAETLFSARDFAALRAMLAPMEETQMAEYIAMLREPGALTAALNWYRAMGDGLQDAQSLAMETEVPTLFVWGSKDLSVSPYTVASQAQYMQGPYEEMELDAGHWLFREQGEATIAAVLAHIAAFDEPN